MTPVCLTKLTVLLTAMAVTSVGCSHTQQPERKVYVVSEDASGVGSNAESGTGGAGADAYCNELEKQCFKKCWRRKPELSTIEKHCCKQAKGLVTRWQKFQDLTWMK